MTQRTTLPQRRSAETRQQILDAAYRVFVRTGCGAASVDESIAESDVSKGALYHHFNGKEAIFQALLADHVRRCAEQMTAAIDASASVAGNIRNVLRASIETIRADPAWSVLQMEFWMHATREPWARDAVAASYERCRELMTGTVTVLKQAGIVRDAVDPRSAAILFAALFDGVFVQWQVEPDEVDLDKLLVPMAELITCYLLASEEQVRSFGEIRSDVATVPVERRQHDHHG